MDRAEAQDRPLQHHCLTPIHVLMASSSAFSAPPRESRPLSPAPV